MAREECLASWDVRWEHRVGIKLSVLLDNTNLIGRDLLITLQEKVLFQMVWEESEMGHILNMGQCKTIQIKVDQLTSEWLPKAHSETN